MTRVLVISLLIIGVIAAFLSYRNNILANTLKDRESRIAELETSLKEQKNLIKVYSQAEEKAKEFEKEMENDQTDNLDVVPADYILNQLRAD